MAKKADFQIWGRSEVKLYFTYSTLLYFTLLCALRHDYVASSAPSLFDMRLETLRQMGSLSKRLSALLGRLFDCADPTQKTKEKNPTEMSRCTHNNWFLSSVLLSLSQSH